MTVIGKMKQNWRTFVDIYKAIVTAFQKYFLGYYLHNLYPVKGDMVIISLGLYVGKKKVLVIIYLLHLLEDLYYDKLVKKNIDARGNFLYYAMGMAS